jgi:hypothetical protein
MDHFHIFGISRLAKEPKNKQPLRILIVTHICQVIKVNECTFYASLINLGEAADAQMSLLNNAMALH